MIIRIRVTIVLFLLTLLNGRAQILDCPENSSPNPNYCCGHDQNLNSSTNKIFYWGGNNNAADHTFCDLTHYQITNRPFMYYKSGDWMLVWNDQFNHYSTLDGSFYLPSTSMTFNTSVANNISSTPSSGLTRFMQDPSLIKINHNGNGKLQLFEKYDPDPNSLTPVYEHGFPSSIPPIHCDFGVGYVQTRMRFPDGLRIEADIKTYPMNTVDQWPSFWTYGDNGLELDIFEMPYNPDKSEAENNARQILTYHAKPFGAPLSSMSQDGDLNEEAVEHIFKDSGSNLLNLSTSFHTYRLIWDDWILQWRLDLERVHSVHRFYKWPTGMGNNKAKKRYRKFAIHSATDYSAHSDLYFINKHFPTYFKYNKPQDPVLIIFQNGLKADGSNPAPLSTNIDPNASMDMDYLKIWVKTDYCGQTRNVTGNNINISYQGQSAINQTFPEVTSHSHRCYLEAAGTVNFVPNNGVTIEWTQFGLFVATNEIAFQDGFSAHWGSNIFSFITIPCETSNNNRPADEPYDSLEVFGPDTIPYYHTNGEIDTTNYFSGGAGARIWSQATDDSFGIYNAATEASKSNEFLRNDIILKTNEGGFTLESIGSEITSVELLDCNASLVRRYSDPELRIFSVSKQGLAEGIYTCIIYTSVGIEVRKVWIWH